MWVLMQDGSAIDNDNGDEMYVDLGADGIVRVYRNEKVVASFTSIPAARNFIKHFVEEKQVVSG